MNTALVLRSRRLLTVVVFSTLLSLVALYAPVALDGLAGTALTPAVYACGPQSGGGDC